MRLFTKILAFVLLNACPDHSRADDYYYLKLNYGILENNYRLTKELYYRDIRRQSGFGLNFTALEFPFSGILLKDGRNTCSGTLITQDIFLSAAHCVCETPMGASAVYSKDKQSCIDANLPRASKYEVFFPATGKVYSTAGVPEIHNEYHIINTENWYQTEKIADLSVFKLVEPVGIKPVPIANDQKKGLLLVNGFGETRITKGDPKDPNGTLAAGVYHNLPVAAFMTPDTSPDRCPSNLKDAICEKSFGDDPSHNGHELPCRGDSGGGLIAIDKGGNITLRGVTSVVKENYSCSDGSGSAVFTDLDGYHDWLQSFSALPKLNVNIKGGNSAQKCVESFIQLPTDAPTSVEIQDSFDLSSVIISTAELRFKDEDFQSGRCISIGDDGNNMKRCSVDKNSVLTFPGKGFGGALVILCRR